MATFTLLVLIVTTSILASIAAPGHGRNRKSLRPHRDFDTHPQEAMMFSGFYGQPSSRYGHQGSMSAFANRDMIFTHSMAGEEYPIIIQDENTAKTQSSYKPGPQIYGQEEIGTTNDEEEQEDAIEKGKQIPTTTRKPNKPKTNKIHKKQQPTTSVTPVEENHADSIDEDQDEEVQDPSRGAQRPSSPGNTYFPVIFGQGGHSRNAVAIANAFSTGKGGIASAHATAYGDPYFSTLGQRRNQYGQKNKRRS